MLRACKNTLKWVLNKKEGKPGLTQEGLKGLAQVQLSRQGRQVMGRCTQRRPKND